MSGQQKLTPLMLADASFSLLLESVLLDMEP